MEQFVSFIHEKNYLKILFCEKRNAFTPLGIRPAIERSWARYPAEWKRSFYHRINFSNIYWKFHLVLNDFNSKSQVDKVDMVVRLSWWVIHSSNYRHNRLKWFGKICRKTIFHLKVLDKQLYHWFGKLKKNNLSSYQIQ